MGKLMCLSEIDLNASQWSIPSNLGNQIFLCNCLGINK